ncbi:MAG: hypothetical protein JJU29_03810 [Verrucomicrobia bacterium]|nr:hypothetical protein [Verrucomicrobiota bacterium]MCH8510905.1 hypothetical protein [Kiritimatiellia bacterium]
MSDPTPDPTTKKKPAKGNAEAFYDSQFSIEAMQNEPCENGFTWRTVVGALFIALVMLPGIIFMGLMIGEDMGSAADWVVIILFVEIARRSFITLRKQELYILKYTVSSLSSVSGSVALGGGVFAWMVFNRYLRNSEEFANFGIAHEVPDWFAPFGDAAYQGGFFAEVWWPVLIVTVLTMVLNKLTQLSLGFLAYKVTVDVEQLPFPLAPIQAEGAIALAESSEDKDKKNFRQYCFSIGAMIGAVFGIFYVAVPILTSAFFDRPLQLIPIPFLDLTLAMEHIIPGALIGITLNLGLLFTGFVLPWRIAVGMFFSTVFFKIIFNTVLQRNGLLPSWAPGKDAIETQVADTLDFYLSFGIGTSFAVFAVGLFGMIKAIKAYSKKSKSSDDDVHASGGGDIDLSKFWERNKDRGDPPTGLMVGIWVISAFCFVLLSNHLINAGTPAEERFPVAWLMGFAFLWTPINTYINARMSGIAGQHAGVPFVFESAIFASGYRGVNIWFAPLPLNNYGGVADMFRVCELTRTKLTSIFKAELFIFPLMLVASFIFWSYITGLGPIPSDNYPYVQKFWPMHAQMRALWASAMQEGQSLLLDALKPGVIGGSFALGCALFAGFAFLGISSQYIYGALAAANGYPHNAIMIFAGACLGRYVLAQKFGKERWQNFAPILAVGFGAGMGLVGMLAIAINFLWASIGVSY